MMNAELVVLQVLALIPFGIPHSTFCIRVGLAGPGTM
jgi:hypothetical protein